MSTYPAIDALRHGAAGYVHSVPGRRPFRLGYLVSHPIQYQAPMLRHIANDRDIDLTVFYMSDMSVRGFHDPDFGVRISWDVPLLGGYRHIFLKHVGGSTVTQLLRPVVVGLQREFERAQLDALWLHGYKHQVQLRAILAARRMNIPLFVRGDSNGLERTARDLVSAQALRWLFRKIDGFLCIGKRNRKFYVDHGVEHARLFPVPYAVDNAMFQQASSQAARSRVELRRSLGMIGKGLVILFVAKLTKGKRPLDLLEAYHRLMPRFTPGLEPYLIYVGDGEERARLEQRARELKLTRVRVTGFANQSELPRYYDLCDVFVLPSERDRWGLAVNEVMNAGKPVIVTDQVGCSPDLVPEERNGFVVPVGDVASLASKLLRLLKDGDLRARMGEASRKIVANFSFEEDLQGIKWALSSLCSRPNA